MIRITLIGFKLEILAALCLIFWITRDPRDHEANARGRRRLGKMLSDAADRIAGRDEIPVSLGANVWHLDGPDRRTTPFLKALPAPHELADHNAEK